MYEALGSYGHCHGFLHGFLHGHLPFKLIIKTFALNAYSPYFRPFSKITTMVGCFVVNVQVNRPISIQHSRKKYKIPVFKINLFIFKYTCWWKCSNFLSPFHEQWDFNFCSKFFMAGSFQSAVNAYTHAIRLSQGKMPSYPLVISWLHCVSWYMPWL